MEIHPLLPQAHYCDLLKMAMQEIQNLRSQVYRDLELYNLHRDWGVYFHQPDRVMEVLLIQISRYQLVLDHHVLDR